MTMVRDFSTKEKKMNKLNPKFNKLEDRPTLADLKKSL
jgi:hypothetical protein